MMPGEEIIHVLPQEYKVDGQGDVDEPVGMFGGRLEATFHIVVGQVTSIRNIARCVKNSGLELGSVNLEPLASAEAVLSEEEKEAGVVLIDIGGGTTDVAHFQGWHHPTHCGHPPWRQHHHPRHQGGLQHH